MNQFAKGLGIFSLSLILPFTALAVEPDLDKGARVFKKCQACHTLEEGGTNRIGPNLFGLFERTAATTPDFNYSDAMIEKAEEIGVWNDETLDAYFVKPRDYVPGTTMSFAGLRKESQRINLIAFLRQETGAPAAAE